MEKFVSLIEKLTGQRIPIKLDEYPNHVVDLLKSGGGIGHSQFNEILLNLGYDRISKPFFCLFVTEFKFVELEKREKQGEKDYKIESMEHFEKSVDSFAKIGIFLYGNVKYAFKKLSSPDLGYLQRIIEALKVGDETVFKKRHKPIQTIAEIPGNRTFLLGFLVDKILKEIKKFNEAQSVELEEEKKKYIKYGKQNHIAYLVSDHLDIYVATSMREMHEYFFVNKYSKRIFENELLSPLNLRYFDPTQVYCADRVDKGLAEALMLKRAMCTVYFIQEIDTMGKDSELAATLAQGKTVIAYVPEVTNEFFEETVSDLIEIYSIMKIPDQDILLKHLQTLKPELAWEDQEVRRWIDEQASGKSVSFSDVKAKLKEVMAAHYSERAEKLKQKHPLGIQVHLNSGVANGVLVVRTIEDCARIIKMVVTKQMEFYLKERIEEGKKYFELRERVSDCIFRVQTGDEILTNAFWNFYVNKEN